MAVKVLIVDDHDGFRRQAHSLLEAAGYDVVGEAEDGKSAVVAVVELQPDVIVIDVQLPDTSGFDVSRLIHRDREAPVVILVSSRDASDYGGRITSSGAQGFLSKSELSADAIAKIIQRAS